jgi:hypothetical protein
MAKPYSEDLRRRLVEAIDGGATICATALLDEDVVLRVSDHTVERLTGSPKRVRHKACRADQGSAFLRERRFLHGPVYRDPIIAAIPPITRSDLSS